MFLLIVMIFVFLEVAAETSPSEEAKEAEEDKTEETKETSTNDEVESLSAAVMSALNTSLSGQGAGHNLVKGLAIRLFVNIVGDGFRFKSSTVNKKNVVASWDYAMSLPYRFHVMLEIVYVALCKSLICKNSEWQKNVHTYRSGYIRKHIKFYKLQCNNYALELKLVLCGFMIASSHLSQ